ncbi:MAG: endonuclease III domain-containing protein [Promethearchaeota archaeon]
MPKKKAKKTEFPIEGIINILKEETGRFEEPIVSQISRKRDPYHVLISCMLSLRTKDEVTSKASKRLFTLANTPEEMVRLSLEEIETAIYPVGFYKNKARYLKETSQTLIDLHKSKVPDTIDELLKLKGVGRKTANLVVTEGYGKPGICVDTHVHRISNRLGYVETQTPEKTEFALRKKLHKKYWIIYNKLLVTWGQNICAPISPKCSQCAINEYCPRIGVTKHR